MPGPLHALLKAADDMLLQAKRLGRNRVLVHDSGSPRRRLTLPGACAGQWLAAPRACRMTIRYDITHTTLYRYREPVSFGEHRVMFRPRDSHDLRVLATDLVCSPEARVRMIQDPHSNSVALVTPLRSATELEIVCTFRIEHAPGDGTELALSPSALIFPFAYSVEERFDLEHYMRPLHDDPDGVLTHWARQFMRTDGPTGTRELLLQMNGFIREHFGYAARDEEGTQSPLQTLQLRHRQLPRLRAADDGGRAPPGHGGAIRLRLPLRPGTRPGGSRLRQARRRWAPAAPMPGCRCTCPAPAGCPSTRPTTCAPAPPS